MMKKMNKKYIKFYQNFHKALQGKKPNYCSNLLSDCRIKRDFSVGRKLYYDLY